MKFSTLAAMAKPIPKHRPNRKSWIAFCMLSSRFSWRTNQRFHLAPGFITYNAVHFEAVRGLERPHPVFRRLRVRKHRLYLGDSGYGVLVRRDRRHDGHDVRSGAGREAHSGVEPAQSFNDVLDLAAVREQDIEEGAYADAGHFRSAR
jgi:hypothetical protein